MTLEMDTEDAAALLHRVVELELMHWVPNASQRLVHRAFTLVGQPHREPQAPDCGPRHRDHPLIATWVAGWYVMQCCRCDRLFEHS